MVDLAVRRRNRNGESRAVNRGDLPDLGDPSGDSDGIDRIARDTERRGNVPIGREGYAVAGVCASNVVNLCYFDRRAAAS